MQIVTMQGHIKRSRRKELNNLWGVPNAHINLPQLQLEKNINRMKFVKKGCSDETSVNNRFDVQIAAGIGDC